MPARNSGSLKVNMSSVVRHDATPPPPTSLICEAPWNSCSRAHPDLIRAVCDTGTACPLQIAQRTARAPRKIGEGAHVSMAAGRRDHGSGGKDARPCHEPFVDRLLQRKGWAADVPDGGEA